MTDTPPHDQTPDHAVPPVRATRHGRAMTAVALTLLGGALVALSALLEWAVVIDSHQGTVVIDGMTNGRDGVIALILGVITLSAGLAGLFSVPSALVRRSPIALGVLAGWVALANLDLIASQAAYANLWASDNAWTRVETGAGLYVLLVGAVVTFLSGFGPRRRA